MSTTTVLPLSPAEQPAAGRPRVAAELRQAAIRASVLKALGRPALLFQVVVKPLWGNNYRVNVVTGEHAASVIIPNSYFVAADDAGNILGSMPRIQKLY